MYNQVVHIFSLIVLRRKKKPHKVYTTPTASYSSTLAEEFVVLLRKLHTLPVWNDPINQHISINLHAIATFILDQPPSSSSIDSDGSKVSVKMTIFSIKVHFLLSLCTGNLGKRV